MHCILIPNERGERKDSPPRAFRGLSWSRCPPTRALVQKGASSFRQMGESIQKGRNRERTPWQPPLDSAPPVNTDDSEPALDRVPQPLWIRNPQRFRRTLKPGPFLRSAPNRTGTTHPVTHGRRTSTKNNKSVKENGDGCHANLLSGPKRGKGGDWMEG